MLKLIPLILRNVLRSRRRSLLTLASMAVSLTLLTIVIALYYGLFVAADDSPSQARRVLTRHKVSLVQSMPISYREKIAALEEVEAVSPWVWFQGKYREPKDFFARLGGDPKTIFEVRKDLTMPPEQLAAFKSTRSGCVAGEALAKRFGWKLGEKIIIVGDIFAGVTLDMTLVGIFSAPDINDTELLIFSQEYLSELLSSGAAERDRVGMFIMLAKKAENVPVLARKIDTMFANSQSPTRTQSEKEFQRSFLSFIGNIKLFLMAICVAVTFTILLVSANTIAMSVRERTRELAIVRTLGYSPGEIMGLIVGEAVVLSLIGGAIGIGMGSALSQVLGATVGRFLGFRGIAWEAAAIAMAMALLIGTVSSVIPALIASRKNIVDSLRFTG